MIEKGLYHISLRNGVKITLRNGREALSLFLKADEFQRNDDLYHAHLTEALVDQIDAAGRSYAGWFMVDEDSARLTIPERNIAGWQWIEDKPIVEEKPVDLEEIRRLLEGPPRAD